MYAFHIKTFLFCIVSNIVSHSPPCFNVVSSAVIAETFERDGNSFRTN